RELPLLRNAARARGRSRVRRPRRGLDAGMSGVLQGRRAVITGATANIGAATARRFAEEGAALVLVDVNPEIETTAASIRARGVSADVSDAAQVEAFAADVKERLGGLDVLVNNAAIQRVGGVVDFPLEEWDATMAVNLRSCFLTVRAFVPMLRESQHASI